MERCVQCSSNKKVSVGRINIKLLFYNYTIMTVVFVKYGQTQFRKQQADSDTLFAVDLTFLARWKCTKECFLLFFVKLRTFILQQKKIKIKHIML